jgi:hypothetical protein
MNQLPLEIVNRILEYDGRIKYRHGKYMNQIAQDDYRYQMLQQMPQIEPYYNHRFWYMSIPHRQNKIHCVKHIYSYLDLVNEPILFESYSDTNVVRYYFYNQGFYYKFTIYKPTQLYKFTKSVLQKIYSFIDDIKTFIHLSCR